MIALVLLVVVAFIVAVSVLVEACHRASLSRARGRALAIHRHPSNYRGA